MKYTATVLALALAVLSWAQQDFGPDGSQAFGPDGSQDFGPDLTDTALGALDNLPNFPHPQARNGPDLRCALTCLANTITECHLDDYDCICHYWNPGLYHSPRVSDCVHTRCGNLDLASRTTPLICIQSSN